MKILILLLIFTLGLIVFTDVGSIYQCERGRRRR